MVGNHGKEGVGREISLGGGGRGTICMEHPTNSFIYELIQLVIY